MEPPLEPPPGPGTGANAPFAAGGGPPYNSGRSTGRAGAPRRPLPPLPRREAACFALRRRLDNLAPYALAKVFAARDAKLAEGVDVIDLGVGNPDMRPAPHIMTRSRPRSTTRQPNHRYPSFNGLPEFRQAIAAGTTAASA